MKMSKRQAVLISNPNAGRGGAQRAREVARFCQHLKSRGVEVEVIKTAGPNDAARQAARAASAGAREVIVSGGDGTINEALQGLVGTGARLGVWPSGTANVLARELKLPFEAERAAEVIARGRIQRVRVGCATNERTNEARYFFLMLRYLYLLTHAMRRDGVAEEMRGVQFIRTMRARVTGSALVQADGELIGQLPMTFEIAPAPIEIIT
jgi:diacylglycerol kinase family enzyme